MSAGRKDRKKSRADFFAAVRRGAKSQSAANPGLLADLSKTVKGLFSQEASAEEAKRVKRRGRK